MSLIDQQQLAQMDRKQRIRLHNSLLGGKPVHLLGTQDASGIPNLAVFNSACHVSSDPPLIGIMCRPLSVRRDSYANIQSTGVWTLNAISADIVAAAHRAADKLPAAASEFEYTGLSPQWQNDFAAPAVAESPLSMGFALRDEVPIRCSGTVMLIGELQWLRLPSQALLEDGSLQAEQAGMLSSLGLDAYAEVREVARFVYQSQSRS